MLALVTREEAVCPRRTAMDGIGFLFIEVLSAEGLGNTQYEHYNSMGKWVDARLSALGARRHTAPPVSRRLRD